MRNRKYVAFCVASAAALAAGCGQKYFPDAFDTTLTDTNRIVNDSTLDPDQKRDALAALGIPPSTINAILRDTRTANQFGGTLETAYNKVVAGTFTTLTPDEIQLYGDATDEATFSDAAALSLSEFFIDTQINTAKQLEDFLAIDGNELPSGLDAGEVKAVFVDFDTNEVLAKLP